MDPVTLIALLARLVEIGRVVLGPEKTAELEEKLKGAVNMTVEELLGLISEVSGLVKAGADTKAAEMRAALANPAIKKTPLGGAGTRALGVLLAVGLALGVSGCASSTWNYHDASVQQTAAGQVRVDPFYGYTLPPAPAGASEDPGDYALYWDAPLQRFVVTAPVATSTD
jgi:hypothetical protein